MRKLFLFFPSFLGWERYIRRGEQVAEAALPQLRELVGTRRKH
jgi:hypothetical protein